MEDFSAVFIQRREKNTGFQEIREPVPGMAGYQGIEPGCMEYWKNGVIWPQVQADFQRNFFCDFL